MFLSIEIKDKPGTRASVIFRRDGAVVTNLWGDGRWWQVMDPALTNECTEWRRDPSSDEVWHKLLGMDALAVAKEVMPSGYRPSGRPKFADGEISVPGSEPEAEDKAAGPSKAKIKEIVRHWFQFFSEFQFVPQPRFMNSLFRQKSLKDIRGYVMGYFELTNNSFAADVAEKVKSREFEDLAADTKSVVTEKQINTRLEIYYGVAGSGKTTLARVNNPDSEVVLVHQGMTPDELFRGFDIEEEKDETGRVTGSHPVFRGCPLRTAMEEGKVVILDEINLLSTDCLRALQAVTDGKPKVTIGTEEIEIKDGFKVVGTMNLNIGDQVFGLPDPLVDRAEVIKKFELDADTVAELAV